MPRRNPLNVPQLQTAPNYRFWGSRKPPTQRDPIKASVVTNDDGNGTAVIRLYDPIDSWGGIWGVSASEFAEALDALDPSVTQIVLHINCPGGEVFEGIAILNLLRQHPANVTAVVDSLAASAASFIATGVDETVMAPNSQLMIHDAWGICVGASVDMTHMASLLDRVSNNVASVYQSKAGGTLQDWRVAMLAETWYDAQEAVDAGLADEVADDENDEQTEAGEIVPNNAFDLSQFKHEGRADAPAPSVVSSKDDAAAALADVAVAASARARHLTLRQKAS